MKKFKLCIFLTLFLSIISCAKEKGADETSAPEGVVEVLYFHGDMRCRNCVAMERAAKELLEEQYKEKTDNGKIVFKEIDITTPEGEKIGDKYQVSWSSLIIATNDGKAEKHLDLTKEGFKYAVKEKQKFKDILSENIDSYLK